MSATLPDIIRVVQNRSSSWQQWTTTLAYYAHSSYTTKLVCPYYSRSNCFYAYMNHLVSGARNTFHREKKMYFNSNQIPFVWNGDSVRRRPRNDDLIKFHSSPLLFWCETFLHFAPHNKLTEERKWGRWILNKILKPKRKFKKICKASSASVSELNLAVKPTVFVRPFIIVTDTFSLAPFYPAK